MQKKLITFLYHDVSDRPETSGFQRRGALPYKHSVGHFMADVEAIGNQHATALPVSVALEETATALIMTFDDGGVSALDIAQILTERGWVGHFFVTTGMIGEPGFLTEGGIRGLSSAGHVIGSHSHTHPDIFRDISYDRKLEEWRISKEKLESILGEKVESASVPGGDMDDDTIRAAGEVGLKFLFTSEPNYIPFEKFGVKCIGRVCPKNTTPTTQVLTWASGQGYFRAQALRKTKELLRRYGRPLYRLYVRSNERKSANGFE